jgi:hypothetical protein
MYSTLVVLCGWLKFAAESCGERENPFVQVVRNIPVLIRNMDLPKKYDPDISI